MTDSQCAAVISFNCSLETAELNSLINDYMTSRDSKYKDTIFIFIT